MMRTIVRILFASAILLVAGCDQEIRIEETVNRNGRIHLKGDGAPFTGYVVGTGRENYRRQPCRFRKHYEDGILNGESRFWYPNGRLESVEPYRNGTINGVVTRYRENGKILARVHLVDGKRGGKHGEFFFHPARGRAGRPPGG